MSKYKEIFTSPVGRLVQGDVYKMQETDSEGRPRVFKSGPKIGQPNPQIFAAVAFPKQVIHPTSGQLVDNWEFNELYALLDKVARVEWPNLFPQPAPAGCTARDFAWKLLDGDGYDTKGKANFEKEGFAGHWVLRFGSGYVPKALRETSPNVFEPTADIKRGYYIRVAGNVTGNDSTQTPGIYLNLELVQLVGFGPEIVGGMDPTAAFGNRTGGAMPQGMSATPIGGAAAPHPSAAPAPGGTPALPGAAAPAPAPGGPAPAPGPGPGPAAGPTPATTPHTGYMGNGASTAAAPPPPASAPAATASPTRTMTAAATTTYDAYITAGWTDDTLRQHGLMI